MLDFREQVKTMLDSRKVGIVEFAESPEFCGKPLYPRQKVLLKLIFLEEMDEYEESVLDEWISGVHGVEISPAIRERRQWLRDNNYTHFPEVGLVGGRRSSKGYVSGIVLTRIMYDTWKMGDPGRQFGVDPDKEIYFSCLAASKDQAKKFQFADFVSTVTRCKPFIESDAGLGKVQEESVSVHTSSDRFYIAELKRQKVPVGRNFAKLRGNPLAANADSVRGSSTMAVIFDEMAWMETVDGNRSSAEECYTAIEPSLAQFGKSSIMMLNSSPYTKIGKFYDRFANSMEVEEDGSPVYRTLFFFKFPSWELYRDYERDPQFNNALMVSPDQDATLIKNEVDRALCIAAQLSEKANPEKFKVERRAEWAEVVNAYLQPEMVDAAFAPLYGEKPIKRTQMGNYEFMPYVMHCDPSSTTAGFGFAIAHVEQFKHLTTGIIDDHVVFDYVKRWDPNEFENSTIDYLQVMKELVYFMELYRPRSLTFDPWNSVAPIQWLQKEVNERRISTTVGVVTPTKARNWNRWELFKTTLNMGRIHIPPDCMDSNYAALELKFLQEKGGSVEKQNVGPVQTKDIADCIAECTRILMADIIGYGGEADLNYSSFGAQGGYQIGGFQNNPNANHPMSDWYKQSAALREQSRFAKTRSMTYRGRRTR